MSQEIKDIKDIIVTSIGAEQQEIGRIINALGNLGFKKEPILSAFAFGSEGELSNSPEITELRRLCGIAMPKLVQAIGPQYLQIVSLDDIKDKRTATAEEATAQHQLEARNRGRKIDLPDLLVSGVSIWVFPMEPRERLPVHDHKFNVGSIAVTPVTEIVFAAREHGGGNQSLEVVSNKPREAGSANALNPAGDNIHTIINNSDQPGVTIHIVGFSPQNGIQHPVRRVYTGEKAPPGATLRVGPWSVSGISPTECGLWEIRTSLPELLEPSSRTSPDISPGGERI